MSQCLNKLGVTDVVVRNDIEFRHPVPDTTNNLINAYGVDMTIFSMTTPTSISAITQTTIVGAGRGSTTIPANTFRPGSVLKLTCFGTIVGGGGTEVVLGLYINGVVVLTRAHTYNPASSGYVGLASFGINTIGASGTCESAYMFTSGPAGGGLDCGDASIAPIAIDTTISNSFDVRFNFDTAAGNSLNTRILTCVLAI